MVELSIVVPIFNERENLRPLYDQLTRALDEFEGGWELIFVDDGSTDGSSRSIDQIAAEDPAKVVGIHFRRNFGQTAALQAGLEAARGEVLVTLDGDLQNDPRDIPPMVAALREGFDLVQGWRQCRHDAWLTRRLPSAIANRLIARTTGLELHDLGCTLRAMRREIAEELDLHGELHRFLPVLAHARGARCLEMPVEHHPRRHGTSKYTLSRVPRVLLDLLTVKFLTEYADRPMRLHGRLALATATGGALSFGATLAMKMVDGTEMTGNPLLLLAMMLSLVSLQLVAAGLLGEMSTRMYYRHSARRPFAIRNTAPSPIDPQPLSHVSPQRRAA